MPRFRLSLAVALLLAGTACGNGPLGGGGGGQVVQIGDDLNNIPPNSNVTCADGFPIQINSSFPQPFTAGGAQSCLLITFFAGTGLSRPGTVVSANIRVGAVTGPMRFVRARILYQSATGQACCSVEQFGPVFTPQANAITTVPLNFQMTEDHVPPPEDPTIVANDLVALEVLAPNVPIPGNWVNNGGGVLTMPNYIYFPSFSQRGLSAPTQNLRSDGSYSGFEPSFNLNFAPAGAPAATTGPTE